jgi:hypothetical protein
MKMTEQTKHTPGPWKAVRNTAYWEIEPANAGQDGIPFNVGDVCASAPGMPDSGLQEANARLIAAAPDLLEALEAFRLAFELDGIQTNNIPAEMALGSAIEKARAALSKAKES